MSNLNNQQKGVGFEVEWDHQFSASGKTEKYEVLKDVLSRVVKEDRLQLTKMEYGQDRGPASSSGHSH